MNVNLATSGGSYPQPLSWQTSGVSYPQPQPLSWQTWPAAQYFSAVGCTCGKRAPRKQEAVKLDGRNIIEATRDVFVCPDCGVIATP